MFAALTFSLALAVLGPEVPLSPRIELGPAAHVQLPISVASNGGDFVALWATYETVFGGPLSLHLDRIDTNGQAVPGAGATIALGALSAQLAATEDGYLLVYMVGTTIYAQRVGENAELLGEPRVVASELLPRALGRLVPNGNVFLQLVQSSERGGVTSAIVLDGNGAVVRELAPFGPSIVFAGVQNGEFVVIDAVNEKYALHRFSLFGPRSDIPLAWSGQGNLRFAAGSPDRIFIVHSEAPGYRTRVIDGSGAVVSESTSSPCPVADNRGINAWWDGSQFVASCVGIDGQLFATRHTEDGMKVGGAAVLSSTAGQTPLFAGNGTTQMLVWADDRFSTEWDIVARAVAGTDSIAAGAEPRLVSYSARAQRAVQIARAGRRRLAIWRDDTRTRFDSVLDGLTVSVERTTVPSGRPAVIAGSRSFLTVWNDAAKTQLLGRRIGFSGELLDPEPLALATAYNSRDTTPATAFRAPLFVVALPDDEVAGVTEDGVTPAAHTIARPLGPSNYALLKPMFVGSDLRYAVAQFEGGLHYSPGIFPYWFRFSVGAPGAALETGPMRSGSFLGTDPLRAAVAQGPGRLLWAWIEGDFSRRIAVGLAPLHGTQALGGPVVVPGETRPMEIEAVWNGTEYVVAWSGQIEGEAAPRIRAMRFEETGRPLDAAPISISPMGATHDKPSFAVTADGVDIAYSRLDLQYGGAPRAYVRSLARLLPLVPRRPSVRH